MKKSTIIYCIANLISCFSICIGSVLLSSISYGQDNFVYQDYFPKEKVDSVQWYYGGIAKEDAEKIDSTKEISQNLEMYFLNDDFPFDNPKPLLDNYLEKRAVLTDVSDIQELTKVFPTNSCESYAVTRCGAIYRDILIFYKDGIAVSVLKVCFSCKQVCFVSNNGEQDKNAKCLSNPLSLKEIAKEWVRRDWIDLRKGR